MGLCHEFGSQIRAGCDHPMRAGASACTCAECGVVCRGLFDGCSDVWARGPRPVSISATRAGGAARASLTTAHRGPDERGIAQPSLGPGSGARGAGRWEGDPADDHHAGHDPGRGAGRGSTQGDDDSRREILRWFGEAFEGVRGELQAIIGNMTRQQAMLAELIDSRQAELRLALVAESLPDIVADAVRSAMDEQAAVLARALDRANERLVADTAEAKQATETAADSLHEAFRRLADAMALHDEEAELREASRVDDLTEELADLRARIDALASRIGTPGRSRPATWAPPPTANLVSTSRMRSTEPSSGSGRSSPSNGTAATDDATGGLTSRHRDDPDADQDDGSPSADGSERAEGGAPRYGDEPEPRSDADRGRALRSGTTRSIRARTNR